MAHPTQSPKAHESQVQRGYSNQSERNTPTDADGTGKAIHRDEEQRKPHEAAQDTPSSVNRETIHKAQSLNKN